MIKTLLDKNDPVSGDAPEKFEDDELSVIVVVPNAASVNEALRFLIRVTKNNAAVQ